MIKLTNILSEVLNTFQVEATLVSDKKTNISSILDQIRGLHKVTIVTNITQDKKSNPNYEFTKDFTLSNISGFLSINFFIIAPKAIIPTISLTGFLFSFNIFVNLIIIFLTCW